MLALFIEFSNLLIFFAAHAAGILLRAVEYEPDYLYICLAPG